MIFGKKRPASPEEKGDSVDSIEDFETKDEDYYFKKNQSLKKGLALTIFFTVMVVGFLLYLKTDINVNNNSLAGMLGFSVLINLVIILLAFGTGVGQGLIAHFKKKMLFPSGRYVNTFYISKNGTIREFFKPVDNETGTFKINDKTYTRNPSLMKHWKKIPTYVHREGNPDPLNLFEDKYTAEISEAEIDQAMNSKNSFDFKKWLEDNKLVLFIGIFVVVSIAAAAAYAGFNVMTMLQDGTYKAVQCVQPAAEIVAGVPGI